MNAIRRALRERARPEKRAVLERFFKTGPGEYGEGDRFLGVMVPEIRAVAKEYRRASLAIIEQLLASSIHEERLVALLILVDHYEQSATTKQERIAQFYLAHLARVNNWDLVDLTAPKILGAYTYRTGQEELLDRLAISALLWERRVAIVSTLHHIRAGRSAPTLRLAAALLNDNEDLLHKATGWMLREVGKRDKQALLGFLTAHAARMPRTMLRYAIERFPERERQRWLRVRRRARSS